MIPLDYNAPTALVFPPGGAHWPGMGSESEIFDDFRSLIEQAEAVLPGLEVPPKSLFRLMAGENQATRSNEPTGWQWHGDFPLSVTAQTVLGIALGRAVIATWGKPAAIAGESMGEIAAYCVSGALELEEAVILAYRWAQAYQRASHNLGLKMAVVDFLTLDQLEAIVESFQARVVVFESKTLCVLSLPANKLRQLEETVAGLGGRILVSNNPCAAHDPRLRQQSMVWEPHLAFLQKLKLQSPHLPLFSALQPGRQLETIFALRENLATSSFTPVHWGDTILTFVALGIRNILQLGAPSRPYNLEKLQTEYPLLKDLRFKAKKTLTGIYKIGAKPRSQVCSERT